MEKGERVRSYTLDEQISGRGTGEVWTARHASDSTPRFAIKFLKKDFRDDAPTRARFLKECAIQIGLRHPNIVMAWETIEDPPGLVLDLAPGGSLAKEIKGQSLSSERIIQISLHVLDALDFAHQRGIIHRDVKPQNILIGSDQRALLTDFGIALKWGDERITQTGEVVGSLSYMSPEQIGDPKNIDHRTDIYSFGCVLYEMLTGKPPIPEDSDITARLQPQIKTPSKRNPAAPRGFDIIAMTCLQKDPEARYQTCSEVKEAFEKKTGISSTALVPANPPPVLENSQADGKGQPPMSERPQPVLLVAKEVPLPPVPPVAKKVPEPEPEVSGSRGRRWVTWITTAVAVLLIAALTLAFLPRTPDENVVLTMYGSTSIGDELALAMSREFLKARMGATETGCYQITKTYTGNRVPMEHCWGKIPGSSQRQVVEVYSVGSEKAFECLAAKTCDIGMSSRPFDLQGDLAKHPGLENLATEASEHVIGLDGIAIVVNAQTPLQKLTVGQVQRIFCETAQPVNTWDELGIPNLGQIRRMIRNEGSGTREMFAKQVCQGAKLREVAPQDQLKSEDLVNVVASPSGRAAIGFVSSTLTGRAMAVPLASSEGQPAYRPDDFRIATEDYTLTRRLFLFNNSSISPIADKFIKFAVDREGQEVAKENKFVSLSAEAVGATPSNATPEFKAMTMDARRLSLSFRFGTGSTDLAPDRLAEDNLERVRGYLERNPGTQLLVLGFADNRPSRGGPSNQKLSELRADAIASALEGRLGIPSSSLVAKGFGEGMPVDTNETPTGQYKNRRVEIWVRQ